jgi:hypothetical protein
MASALSRLTVVPMKAERSKAFGALPTHDQPLTIRFASPEDDAAVRELAVLDSSPPLSGRVLLAEVDGTVIAAASLDGGAVIADPFTPSGYAVRMLTTRRYQLMRQRDHRASAIRRRPRLAPDLPLVVRRGEA